MKLTWRTQHARAIVPGFELEVSLEEHDHGEVWYWEVYRVLKRRRNTETDGRKNIMILGGDCVGQEGGPSGFELATKAAEAALARYKRRKRKRTS